MKKICTVGLGYIGLPTASLMATKGFQVQGVDINTETVNSIRQGKVHIYEPDLDVLVKAAVQSKNLTADTKPEKADVFILAVPTPFKENQKPDLSYVENATRMIASYIEPGNLVILESTSPVGTTEKVAEWIAQERKDLIVPIRNKNIAKYDQSRVYIAHCPERVLPGRILKELVENDRIIGGIDSESAIKARELYQKFVKGNIYLTDCRTAEMAKLTENAFRDVNIAFANELSLICEELDIDVWDLVSLANRHPRVNILQPGPGVGGHCIAVDPWFIIDSSPETARLIKAARNVNDLKPYHVIEKIRHKAERFKEPKIACLGLAFKADIDDLRESPAVRIVEELSKNEALKLLVVEPHVTVLPKQLKNKQNVQLVDLNNAFANADIIVLLVNHTIFNNVGRESLKEKIVIDTRGIWR